MISPTVNAEKTPSPGPSAGSQRKDHDAASGFCMRRRPQCDQSPPSRSVTLWKPPLQLDPCTVLARRFHGDDGRRGVVLSEVGGAEANVAPPPSMMSLGSGESVGRRVSYLQEESMRTRSGLDAADRMVEIGRVAGRPGAGPQGIGGSR